jgi:excisionase family DNA binding protein
LTLPNDSDKIPLPPAIITIQPLVLTVQEAADVLRVGHDRIYQLMKSGELPFVLFGKSRRIPVDALRRLVEESTRYE